jgi:hypothetical protein
MEKREKKSTKQPKPTCKKHINDIIKKISDSYSKIDKKLAEVSNVCLDKELKVK